MIRSSIGLYLRYCFVATSAVVVIPLLIVVGVALSVSTGTPIAVAVAVGAGLSLIAAVVGSYLWRRRPESMDLSFGELMIWSFVRRRRAEQKIDEGAEVIGLDRGGRPLRRLPMTKQQRLKILHDLAVALETKDSYTHGHSTRVEELVARTASVLELSEEQIAELRLAASLHDVGKIRVPTRILRKPGRLTIDEQLIVQEHSSVGAWMVAGVSNGAVVDAVRHHHERWDGHGYPDGVAGREIPLFARIIAVADAYDAMTSTRSYRPSMTRQQALDEIERGVGRQFDPEIVEAFMATVPRRVPLAALVGLGFAGKLLRKSASWAARYGTGSVAPGVASVGAASVVIASLFSPPAALTRPTPEPQSPNAVVEEGAATDGGDESGSERMGRGRHSDRSKPAHKASRASHASESEDAGREDANHVLGSTEHRPRRNGYGPASGDPQGPPEGAPPNNPPPSNPPPVEPPPTEAPEVEDPNVPKDPQPDLGRDCPEVHPGQGSGGGTLKHCG